MPRSDPKYQELFGGAFASFERSILSARSPWDRYHYDGDDSAVSDAAKRGEILFFSRPLSCFRCHGGFNFSGASAQQTVILSYGYWQRRFGGDAHAIGRVVLIDYIPRQVIGVMPRTFRFLNLAPDVLLPQRVPGGPIPLRRVQPLRYCQAQARRHPGTSESGYRTGTGDLGRYRFGPASDPAASNPT